MIAEFIGTFILVLAIILSGQPLYIAAGFLAAITIAGGVSGAHLNPVVSITKMVSGEMGGVKTGQYIIAQIAGAFTALAVSKSISRAS
jgi:glycerol uptake facilitator protein